MLRFLALLTSLAMVAPQAALAAPAAPGGPDPSACSLAIEAEPSLWMVSGYNLFGSVPASSEYQAALINNGDASCTVQLSSDVADRNFGLSIDGTGPRVGYLLVDALSGDDLSPVNGHSKVSVTRRSYTVAAHSQQLLRFHFETTEPFPGDGLFEQQLVIEADGTNGQPVARQPVTLAVKIDPQALLGLSGAFKRVNGEADVDLGSLEPGPAKVPLILHVRSSRAYLITSQSMNGGNLRIAGSQWSIPYQLLLGGKVVYPDGGTYEGTLNGNSSVDTVAMGFNIGDTSGKAGGTYGDVVTLTIAVR